ncbi:MAG: hypothetical protein ABEJ35_00510 [Halobacteriaceae archaeon]
MARTVRLVLAGPVYAVLAAVAGVVALTLFVVSQQLPLVQALVVGGSLPLQNRLTILVELYPFIGTSFSPLAGATLVVTSAVIGINVALATYHLRVAGPGLKTGSSLGAVVLGTLGAGCAACGSAVLAGLVSLVGATSVVTLLPLDGLEFALLALLAVVLSVHWLSQGLRGSRIRGCPVEL